MNWLGEKNIAINLMDLLADKNEMHFFCKNETSMMLGNNVTGTLIQDGNIFQFSETSTPVEKPDPIHFCQTQMMLESSVKTKEEAEFIFKIMIQKGLRFLFINNTLIKDKFWNWIDLDNRSREINVKFSNMLNLSSSGKKRNDQNGSYIIKYGKVPSPKVTKSDFTIGFSVVDLDGTKVFRFLATSCLVEILLGALLFDFTL